VDWELGKNEKKSSPHPSPKNLKGKKKQGTLSACLGLPIIGGMKFSLHKRVHHHFRPGLIPLAKNTLPIHPKQNSLCFVASNF
jgi:hypothetical protein